MTAPFSEVRGEQLLFHVDGKRVQQVDWDKALHVGGRVAVADDGEGARGGELRTIDVSLPIKAGPHKIGVTFLATHAAPGLDLNGAFDRSTIETGGLPGFTFCPHIGRVRIDGPAQGQAASATDSPIRVRILSCTPEQASEEEGLRTPDRHPAGAAGLARSGHLGRTPEGDRHLAYASKTVPTGNLLLSILDMFDVKADHFGDSTGRLPNI